MRWQKTCTVEGTQAGIIYLDSRVLLQCAVHYTPRLLEQSALCNVADWQCSQLGAQDCSFSSVVSDKSFHSSAEGCQKLEGFGCNVQHLSSNADSSVI